VRIPIKATAREPIKQAGYISATSAFYAQSLLRNAAGPYIWVKLRNQNELSARPLWSRKQTLTNQLGGVTIATTTLSSANICN